MVQCSNCSFVSVCTCLHAQIASKLILHFLDSVHHLKKEKNPRAMPTNAERDLCGITANCRRQMVPYCAHVMSGKPSGTCKRSWEVDNKVINTCMHVPSVFCKPLSTLTPIRWEIHGDIIIIMCHIRWRGYVPLERSALYVLGNFNQW